MLEEKPVEVVSCNLCLQASQLLPGLCQTWLRARSHSFAKQLLCFGYFSLSNYFFYRTCTVTIVPKQFYAFITLEVPGFLEKHNFHRSPRENGTSLRPPLHLSVPQPLLCRPVIHYFPSLPGKCRFKALQARILSNDVHVQCLKLGMDCDLQEFLVYEKIQGGGKRREKSIFEYKKEVKYS